MRTLVTKIMMLAFITLLSASPLFAQYSNATLNGQWFAHTVPVSIGLEGTIFYIGFDGNGTITDCCTFGTVDGSSYSVSASSGVISGTLIIHSLDGGIDTTQFSGQLISENNATLNLLGTIMSFSKILSPGALTDSLVGVLNSPVAGQLNVTIRLDNQGQIVSATGLVPPVSGRVYADSGIFVGHIKTGDTVGHNVDSLWSTWDEFTLVGTYAHDSLNGDIGLDGPRNHDPYGTVHLVRMGIVTGIGSIETPRIPESFSLAQNYPNPFNPGTTISYQLPTQGQVTLKILDVLGREIATLINGEQTAGVKSITWNAVNVPSGIYFYRLQTKAFTQTRKLLLLK